MLVLFACVGCDQSTKYEARHLLEGQGVQHFAGDTLRLVYSENTGAFLGLGSGLPEQMRMMVFSILVGLFLLAFLIYVIKSDAFSKPGVVASALIIGGGFSNLIDRIVHNGVVIDFLNMGIGSLRTGIFNVADMAIMLGAFLLLFVWRHAP